MAAISKTLEQTLARALAHAKARRCELVTLEHLLLALIEDQDASACMDACRLDKARLRKELETYLAEEAASLVVEDVEEAKPSAGFQRVTQRAMLHVDSSGGREVSGANVLLAIFSERESHAAYFLQAQDVTRYDVVNYISHGLTRTPRPNASAPRPPVLPRMIAPAEGFFAYVRAKAPDGAPLQAFELIRFRARAQYAEGDRGRSGRDAYALYRAAADQIEQAQGGEAVWSGAPLGYVSEAADIVWEFARFVRFPSAGEFIAFYDDPRHRDAMLHLDAAVDSRAVMVLRDAPSEAAEEAAA